jgi:hypothetical protein
MSKSGFFASEPIFEVKTPENELGEMSTQQLCFLHVVVWCGGGNKEVLNYDT